MSGLRSVAASTLIVFATAGLVACSNDGSGGGGSQTPIPPSTTASIATTAPCTKTAVKASLGSDVTTIIKVDCVGGFAAGFASTSDHDFNYVVRANGSTWTRVSCNDPDVPKALFQLACTSN